MKKLFFSVVIVALVSGCSAEPSADSPPEEVVNKSPEAVEKDIAANAVDPVTASGVKVDLAAIQGAFAAQCANSPVVNGSCVATANPAEFNCDYALKGDNVFSMKQVTLVEDGETFKLKDVPDHCAAQ